MSIVKKLKSRWKSLVVLALSALILAIGVTFLAEYEVSKTAGRTYNNMDSIPENRVGLLLGTVKLLKDRKPNPYFKYRIEAAVALYKAGKIKYIVASGDNRWLGYNEPLDMKTDLVKAGVPDSVIYLDYAGLRTLDSIIRMDKIFGQKKFTIISQQFHNERAIYIAEHNHLDVVAYNAQAMGSFSGFRNNIREKLARVKLFVDIIVNKQPKHLGDKVEIK